MSASTAWTPILQPLASFSPDLAARLDSSFQSLRKMIMTRRTTQVWETELRKNLSGSDYVDIGLWLSKSTAMDTSILPLDTIVQAFLDVHLLSHYQQRSSALRVLADIQKQIDNLKFGSNGVQQHQHNLLEDLTEVFSDEEEDEDEDYMSTPLNHDLSPPSSEPHSPEHKRQRISNSQDDRDVSQLELSPSSFEEFDGLPIVARNKSKWNKLLRSKPSYWSKKCSSWAKSLQIAFNHRMENTTEDHQQYYQSVVDVLREMRQVLPSIFHDEAWKTAVKTSNLHEIIYLWSDPSGLIIWKSSFMQILMRKHRIHEALSIVLFFWIPQEVTNTWAEQDFFEIFPFQTQGIKIEKSKDFIKALSKNPDIIPRKAYPSSIFFLLSLENFELALEQWLICGMENLGYNVSFFKAKAERKQIYDNIWPHLDQMVPSFFEQLESSLRVIIERSASFRKLKNEPAKHILQNKATLNATCNKCSNLAPEYRCVQKIEVTPQLLEKTYLGCGVSLAEPKDQMEPIPIPHSKPGSKDIQQIMHPDRLNLVKHQWNDKILNNCGMQLSLIVKKGTEEILDFWIYNAFSDDIFKKLVSHHSRLQHVKALTRGSQFNSYSQGKMIPKGARLPMGGAPGDSYAFYTGMDAVTQAELEALFDDAEDSMILSEAGRLILFNVYKELEDTTANGDRLGISGANTYYCNNYTSPLHRDDDAGAGLCAQYDLQAKSDLCEYSFTYADYRIYLVSRSNSLWSFRGSDTHGTMLPSTIPLTEKDRTIARQGGQPDGDGVPPRVSNGTHKPATKTNTEAANKHHRARKTRKEIHDYWQGQE
ncbi:hypothetical protein BDZ97DRAFT_1861869 [Flammula alnicola]|nr:hypothetical protein BDZ97DRAFT_1861869 [Flammula alnicola]